MNTPHTPTALQYGSVCSGIEAISLAWEPLGLQAAWFSEIEPFPSAVLAHRYPHVPNLGDMTRIADRVRTGEITAPDILVGGTPCQAFSIPGARQGLNDPRGALTLSYVELANVIDQTRKGCSEDGTGRGVPIIAFTAQDYGADATKDKAPTLRTKAWPAIAFAQNGRGELRLESGHGQIAGTLLANGGKPGQGMPTVFSVALRGRDHELVAELGCGISSALRASSGGSDKSHVLVPNLEAHLHYTPLEPGGLHCPQWKVRRLMPIECERLQGLPDNWTLVPYRHGKPADDAPRYKAIGNSMAVPCVAWLGQRLLQVLQPPR
ncbi:DNA cytosine methyltransferase [Klebsiella pneumoniae]|uniref:DNA cytosine methyltransferase n=1 Tax=Klebsiella pneumoniae TaxID=573 RepID=UPI001ABC96BC|nr:DNA cytosine methyltransferase [Klebsiella pneumoniae]MBO3719630.1 DNA cytosine methyltransferase [Klebsiella pneumoniae]HCM5829498.1 DNA cytosine methyltransferase [Klebsiella pneumoniae]